MRPAYPLCLLLMAAPASAALATPSDTGVIAKDGVEVSILPTVAPAAGPASVIPASLDIEARTDDAARRMGYRSVRGLINVDCRRSANRFVEMVGYRQAGLKGPGVPSAVSGAWVRPGADSYMAAVTARICAGAAAAPADSGPPPVVVEAADTAPAAPPVPPTSASIIPPPSPAPAPATSVSIIPPPSPAPPPASSVSIIPPPSTVQAAHPPSPVVAQVAASPTAKGAQRVLNALRAQITPPLSGTVEPALVNGAQVYRANVTGFASKAEARAFCLQAAGVSKTCWVRLPSAPKKA